MKAIVIASILCGALAACSFRSQTTVERPTPPATTTVVTAEPPPPPPSTVIVRNP